MASQNIVFGSFSEEEISELFTKETADLRFDWQNNCKHGYSAGNSVLTPSTADLLSLPRLCGEQDRRSYSPGLLSPRIPPNPPTSPVDPQLGVRASTGQSGDGSGSGLIGAKSLSAASRKLNVNALPFVPGVAPPPASAPGSEAGKGVGSGQVKNATVRRLDFVDPESVKTEDGHGLVEQETAPVTSPGGGSEKEGVRESPWPNLTAMQTSGQVTADSRTSVECERPTSGVDNCKVPSGSGISPPPPLSGVEGGMVTDSSSSTFQHTKVTGSDVSAQRVLQAEIASPESTGQTLPTTEHVELSSPSSPSQQQQAPPSELSGTDSHWTHQRGEDVAPSQDTDSRLAEAVSPESDLKSTPAPVPTSDQASQHRTQGETTPTNMPTSASHRRNSETAVSPAHDSSTASAHHHTSKPTSPAHAPSTPTLEQTASTTPTNEATPTTDVPTTVAKVPAKSWAAIVSRTSDTASSSNSSASKASTVPSGTSVQKLPERGCKEAGSVGNGVGEPERVVTPAGRGKLRGGRGRSEEGTVQLRMIGEQLAKWCISHKSKGIQPRGLVNQGNWCYMHAPLQALLGIPAFLNLFRTFNPNPPLSKQPSVTPFMDTMIQFVHEFKNYPRNSSTPQSNSATRKKRSHPNDLVAGSPFKPDYVYEMLHTIRSNLSYKGRQEDTEEFLGCVLDGLHEELVSASKALHNPSAGDRGNAEVDHETTPSSSSSCSDLSPVATPCEGEGPGAGQGDEEWEQVGPKNKSTITRQTSFSESPITEIFGGQLRSALHKQGTKESATFEPFFSLQLDIQPEAITSVKDALDALTAKETVHMSSEVDAYKRLSLARLPPVLIFHLKRFIFTSSGSQKLLKHIHYTTEMELAKELLAPAVKSKVTQSQRTYRLWAVVYHHGKTATGGHYTCDVHHSCLQSWIRVDDSLIKPIPEEFVLRPGGMVNKNAYLLFYRRVDTIC